MPESFEAILARAHAAADAAARQGVRDACDDLKSASMDQVPYDNGDLSRSCKVTIRESGGDVEGVVSYDTPYAVIQHEALDFRHKDGQKAKYLSQPFAERQAEYMQGIADAIREALS